MELSTQDLRNDYLFRVSRGEIATPAELRAMLDKVSLPWKIDLFSGIPHDANSLPLVETWDRDGRYRSTRPDRPPQSLLTDNAFLTVAAANALPSLLAEREALRAACKAAVLRCHLCKGTGKVTFQIKTELDVIRKHTHDCSACEPLRSALAEQPPATTTE